MHCIIIAVVSNVDQLLAKYKAKQREMKAKPAPGRDTSTSVKKKEKSSLYSVSYTCNNL